jgi:hypothetical protein
MKCIIYLGHHKTGSSALQEMFTRNADRLLANGILYPFVEPEGQAYVRALMAGGDPETDLTFKVKSPHNHIGYAMQSEVLPGDYTPARYKLLPTASQMFRSIRAALADTGAQTLLLCSEVFSQYGTRNPAMVRQMLDELGIADVSLYMTLRRPDLHLASWHSQMLKFGRTPLPLSNGGVEKLQHTTHVDFENAVRPWAAAVPRERLFLHTYSDVMTAGGSEAHFTGTFRINTSNFVASKGITNPSIPYAFYDIVGRANHDLPAPLARRFRNAILACRENIDLPTNDNVELFGHDIRSKIANRFTPMQSYLGGLVGREGFFTDIDAVRQSNAIPATFISPAARARAQQIISGRRDLTQAYVWLCNQQI